MTKPSVALGSSLFFRQAARGGHFAAWEEPELFVSEPRAAFLHLR